ncbi:MAG: hypothetical protein K8L97_14420 [Anaerolineae bacterium]|nr:hypothetical protein [Anaerolineae bacterium]
MFKRVRQQQEEIHVKYNPPADGTYPPRLVMLSQSRDNFRSHVKWLREGEHTTLIPNELDVERNGYMCKLIPLNSGMSDVLVNGQPLVLARQLFDGDFIQWQKLRAIFQVDPVKDRRLYMENAPEVLQGKTIKLSHKLKKWVVINEQGVSFDGGQHFGQWDQIDFLAFQQDSGTNRFNIHLTGNGKSDTLKNKMVSLDEQEIASLMEWLWYSMPFDLCVNVLLGRARLGQYFPDAYYAAAYEKVYAPSVNQQRVLPADEKFIFGIKSFGERLWWFAKFVLIWVPVVAAILGLAIAIEIEGDAPFGLKWFVSFITLIPLCGGWFALMFGMSLLPDGIWWVRRFFREKRWRRTDDQII